MSDLRRRDFISLLGGAAAAWPLRAQAQPSGKAHRIGFLGGTSHAEYEGRRVDALRRACASSDTRRARTLSSTIGGPRADTTASLSSQPSW